jgi:iron complex outermembrane receptor protein
MKNILLIFFLVVVSMTAQGQNSVSGTVTDVSSGMPLEGVEVYFPQLEKGSVTDSSGNFKLNNLPKGNFKLLASYIGYETFSKTLLLEAGANNIDIVLSPSAIEMEEVIVSTPFHKLQRENVMKVERASISELRANGAVTLSEGLTNIPGVESVSTGLGIGKPVIRGLSSNRVVVYTQGVRLENQQFGDEHGLGISDAGIESVEVIKGPSSLLYGSDAMGGVLYLNPEKFAPANTTAGDVNLNYFSNTTGLNGNAGLQASGEKFKFLIRGSAASHVDYETGGGERVTNSRFGEYDLKTGIAYQLSNFKTELRYNYNDLKLGIPEAIGAQEKDRTPVAPYQEIGNHILSSKTNIFFKNSSLEATFGYTFNNRKEFEEEDLALVTALDMKLQTLSYNVQYNLPKLGGLETIIGVQGMNQSNANFGEEILIPDAVTNDIGFLGTSHLHFKNGHDLQLGIRFDRRAIQGEANGIPSEMDYIAPLDRSFNSFNSAIGYKWDFLKNFLGRINLASGFRAPNLAELTSNGVHEGTNRYEIGNPDLKRERNIQTDLSFEYNNEHLELYANGFYNTIQDYIFIEPNGEFVGADAVFLYNQQDANLYGAEIGVHLHPHPLDWLHLESSFETVTGKTKSGDFLPLIPANRWTNTLRVEFSKPRKLMKNSYLFVTLQSFFNQDKTSFFETATAGYNLLNMGLGGRMVLGKQPLEFRVSANNLLDKTYISHLSRLKIDGIPNIGRNISLGLSIPI